MTEEIEAIAKRLVVGHKRDGRSIYDPQARSELVRVPAAGRVAGEDCEDVRHHVLSNWLRQHERGTERAVAAWGDVVEMPATSAFVAVQVDAAAPPPRTVTPLDVQVRLPNGTTLDMRGADLDGVIKLIEGLGRLRCSVSTKP
jgi:transposase